MPEIPTDDLEYYLYDVRNGAVVACALAKILEAKRQNRKIISQQVIDGVKIMLNPNIGISPNIAGAGSCYQALKNLQCEPAKATDKVKTKTKMVKSKVAPPSLASNGRVFEATPEGEVLLVELVKEMERILAMLKKTMGE